MFKKFVDMKAFAKSRKDKVHPMKKQRLTDTYNADQKKGATVYLDKKGGKV